MVKDPIDEFIDHIIERYPNNVINDLYFMYKCFLENYSAGEDKKVLKPISVPVWNSIVELSDPVSERLEESNKRVCEDFVSKFEKQLDIIDYPHKELFNLRKMVYEYPADYHNVNLLCRGGTRNVYVVDYGNTSRKKIIKVDKEDAFRNAKRSLDNGYNTENELMIASDIISEGVITPDYIPGKFVEKYSIKGTVSIEEYFDGSLSLQEILNSGHVLSREEFIEVFKNVGTTLSKINNGVSVRSGKGILHRDIKPSNILVKRSCMKEYEQYLDWSRTEADQKCSDVQISFNHINIDSKLIDWANSAYKYTRSDVYSSTRGGLESSDPLLFPGISPIFKKYDESSEVYSLAMTMFMSINGKPMFNYDLENNNVFVESTGRSLLGKDGKIDLNIHDFEVRRAVDGLKIRFHREFKDWLWKGMIRKDDYLYEPGFKTTDLFVRCFLSDLSSW